MIWDIVMIVIAGFALLVLIICLIVKSIKKSPNNNSQNKTNTGIPENFFDKILWVFPDKFKRCIILLCAILFAAFTVIGGYQVLTIRKNDIEEKAQSKIKEEKLRYWNNANNPSLKIGLLRLWDKRNDVPDDIWGKYGEEENKSVQVEMAVHPWFPKELKVLLFSSKEERIRIAVRINTINRDEAIVNLAKMSQIDYDYIRCQIAKNPQTPILVLRAMVNDKSYSVLAELANNPGTPPKSLDTLSTNQKSDVRLNVANNPNTDTDTLKKMIPGEQDEKVLKAIAHNPNASTEVLEELIKKNVVNLSSLSKKTQENNETNQLPKQQSVISEDNLKNMGDSINDEVRREAARYPKISQNLQIKLANDESELVRREIAMNPMTPVKILSKLSNDLKQNVRIAVAENLSTPVKILKRLAVDEERNVRECALFSLISRSQRDWDNEYNNLDDKESNTK